ncbi:MAG: hypothetical protein JO019_01755, partial [Candidatus Kaiserbacteria bacterium]|nr:hypothetical protein [Candidatus Kaiserbacteria bacterium]
MRNQDHEAMSRMVIPYAVPEELPPQVQEQLAKARRRGVFRIAVLYYGGTVGMHYDAD